MGLFGDIGDAIDGGIDVVTDAAGDVLDAGVEVADHAGGALLGGLALGPMGAIYGGTQGVSGLVDQASDALGGAVDYFNRSTGGGGGDVEPAWGTSQPAWADDLISMCVSLGNWPEGSETKLWELRDRYNEMAQTFQTGGEQLNAAKGSILAGWDAPAAESFDGWTQGNNAKLAADAENAGALAGKADGFGTETQYTKISINIAFWITIAEVFAAVVAAFFTFGASLAAGAAEVAGLQLTIRQLMTKLITTAAKDVAIKAAESFAKKGVVRAVAEGAAKGAAKGVFRDLSTQGIQNARGTRDGVNLRKTAGSAGGGAVGGAVGGGIGKGIGSRFPGASTPFGPIWTKPAQTAVTNSIAGPAALGTGTGISTGRWNFPYTPSTVGGAFFKYPVAAGTAIGAASR